MTQGVVVELVLPDDLAAFAHACAGSEDITECVVLALRLLRRDIEDLATDLDFAD